MYLARALTVVYLDPDEGHGYMQVLLFFDWEKVSVFWLVSPLASLSFAGFICHFTCC